MELRVRCFSDPGGMGSGLAQWDRLAVAAQRPLSSPAVIAAWWEHLRPADAELRLITAWDGDRLVGVAPLVRVGRRYSWAGGQALFGEPLAAPGREVEVAAAVASELSGARPRPTSIELETLAGSPSWSTLIRRSWPKPRMLLDRHHRVVSVPRLDLEEDGFEGWLMGLDGKVRQDVRRRRRRLEDAGGTLRLSDPEALRDDVDALLGLHRRRHRASVFRAPGARPMLLQIGERLLTRGRFRLLNVELDGRVIGAQLLFAAGRRVTGFMSGYDRAFGRFAPNLISVPFLVKDMERRGDRTMSLGSGGQRYKYKFATDEEALTRHYLLPMAPRGVGTLLGRAARDRLPARLRRGRQA